ncbi:hypothetical protein C0J52_07063 [Blattella germanica]|nr:hypothetical protein C0J52_07063 [Blattella germanica]
MEKLATLETLSHHAERLEFSLPDQNLLLHLGDACRKRIFLFCRVQKQRNLELSTAIFVSVAILRSPMRVKRLPPNNIDHSTKFLGIVIDSGLGWSSQVNNLAFKEKTMPESDFLDLSWSLHLPFRIMQYILYTETDFEDEIRST